MKTSRKERKRETEGVVEGGRKIMKGRKDGSREAESNK